ncbi:uncharacterized protein TNCV_25621 [Trichonephila clavipes]|uniref:Uncharacterized protein n=1 Tax=Trichonephila clavipes TaxID=2585209 RepID=A0A8X6W1K8_TRICX|nr:uncharacterized protein TNCV_25621 [Trichonephila clavipes]
MFYYGVTKTRPTLGGEKQSVTETRVRNFLDTMSPIEGINIRKEAARRTPKCMPRHKLAYGRWSYLVKRNSLLEFKAVVAKWYSYRIVACLLTSSSPVPLKTRRVGQRCTLNLSRAETSSRWCGVVVRRGVLAQVSSTSLDHGSKLRQSNS